MLVYCYAYEGMYQGLHGIESKCIMEVSDNIEEAKREINEWGEEESTDLIYSFGLEDEYYEDIENEDVEYGDFTESIYYQNRGWCAYKIKSEMLPLGKKELDSLCNQWGDKLFIEKFCEEAIIL